MKNVKSGRRSDSWAKKEYKRYSKQITAFDRFCSKLGEKPADVALAWMLMNPVVTAPIIGPRTMQQLDGSLRSLKIKLGKKELAALDVIFPGPGGEAPEAYAW
jgi:aryl-alcohol dehydrogenase-like predicted oxidoreductase